MNDAYARGVALGIALAMAGAWLVLELERRFRSVHARIDFSNEHICDVDRRVCQLEPSPPDAPST